MRRLLVACAALAGCAEEHASKHAREGVRSAEPHTPLAIGRGGAEVDADPWPFGAPKRLPGDRIYSKVRHHWIRAQPSNNSTWLGYISMGDSVRVKGGDARAALALEEHGETCDVWYAVEPVGYTCTGENATLRADDPDVVELAEHAADRASPWPYRYAESLNTPVYDDPPDAARQAQSELGLADHLATVAYHPVGKGPPKLLDLPAGGRALVDRIVNGSTVAYTAEFDHDGRAFLMTWDRGFVPRDRVTPFPESRFHGVVLGAHHRLPIAFFRHGDAPQYRRDGGGFAETGKSWQRLSWVELSGERAAGSEGELLATRDGLWCRASDAAVADTAAEIPPPILARHSGRRTWLDVSIEGGTMVAYEGATPVYATLMSPGRGGGPLPGVPLLASASTPTGIMAILAKFITATMVSGSISTLIHAEVQYTQNIGGPYAIHGAYWHDRFGERKSGGCVNLSPIDSQRIFEWTEPQLPEGWHGMRSITSAYSFGDKTIVWIRRK